MPESLNEMVGDVPEDDQPLEVDVASASASAAHVVPPPDDVVMEAQLEDGGHEPSGSKAR